MVIVRTIFHALLGPSKCEFSVPATASFMDESSAKQALGECEREAPESSATHSSPPLLYLLRVSMRISISVCFGSDGQLVCIYTQILLDHCVCYVFICFVQVC